jgi:predicted dehydrogenase
MENMKLNRREFLRNSAASGLAVALAGAIPGKAEDTVKKEVRLGFVGIGSRGTVLLRFALMTDGVEIPALCDINEEHLSRAKRLVERSGKKIPDGYSKGPEDFRRLVERPDLDAVVVATPREWHTPVMVAAMKAGKYGATEVPASTSVDECWQLVETSERTGKPCMMLENYCYFRNVMMVLNMARQGFLGDILHCETGYQKDERMFAVGEDGQLSLGGKYMASHTGNLYPTHAVGPAGVLLKVNRGDRFSYLVSMTTRSSSLPSYLYEKLGPGNPVAGTLFADGDINTTMIRTENGSTVILYYDTRCARPWEPDLRIQGSKGIFMGNMDRIYVEGRSAKENAWESTEKYYQEFEHPLWRKHGNKDIPYGRGVCDFLALEQFVQAVRRGTEPPLDVYDAASWSVITQLSGQSVDKKSAAVDFPDFTRGKWKNAREFNYFEA